MTRLNWNAAGERFFEAGVDRGVLYIDSSPGVAWNGLTSVAEAPSGGEPRAYYLDGVKYLNVSSAEEFAATIEAYTYPTEFAQCDGTATVRPGLYLAQQRRKSFGLSYRTMVGNDTDGVSHGYKLHIVYNALVSPSQLSRESIAESTEPTNFSWNITTRPVAMSGYSQSAHIIIDSRDIHPITLAAVEDVLYGTASTPPRIPTLAELITIFDVIVTLEVEDNEDDTFTVTGPADAIQYLEATVVQITWPTVVSVGVDSYSISSDD